MGWKWVGDKRGEGKGKRGDRREWEKEWRKGRRGEEEFVPIQTRNQLFYWEWSRPSFLSLSPSLPFLPSLSAPPFLSLSLPLKSS